MDCFILVEMCRLLPASELPISSYLFILSVIKYIPFSAVYAHFPPCVSEQVKNLCLFKQSADSPALNSSSHLSTLIPATYYRCSSGLLETRCLMSESPSP